MSTSDFASSVLSTRGHVFRLVARRRWSPVWWGLLGALAINACGSEGETSGDGSNTPDMGDAGAAGAPASGGGSSTGGTSPVEACEAGDFDDDDDASTACVKLRDCTAGEYVKKAGTAKSDRACAACEAGTFSAAKNSSACAAWTECSPGQYVSAAGTDTEDRTCAGCASGTFSATANGSACTPWTDCAAGTYVSSAPSATADRACTPCEEGTHTSGPNESVCLLGDACGAGTVQTAPGTSVAPPVCEACEAGSYCAGGATPAEECSDGKWDHDQNPATECAPKTECVLGERVNVEGDATTDRTCTGCTSGSFSAKENALACTPWKSCAAGTRVSNTPSAKEDRVCEPCPDDTYTGGPDESVCQPVGACPAGTVQTAPATDTSAPVCEACEAGNYCAGGTEPAEPCAEDDWDEDESPATVCAPKTDCVAGEFVTDDGSATTDRTCNACADGSYSVTTNALSCATWTVCPDGFLEATPGTPTKDRTCQVGDWVRQFGQASDDEARAMAVDGNGNVYVVGYTSGALPGQTSAGGDDAFVRKYDSTGAAQWTRQLGTNGSDQAYAVSVDGSGNVYVAGYTEGTLPGQTSLGSLDAFVRKYDGTGAAQWTWQFGTAGGEVVNAVSVDGSGNVYVAGYTYGTFSGQTDMPGSDAFVRKYDSTGGEQWTRQFGTVSHERAWAMSVDESGNVYVAGETFGALPGQTDVPGSDAFVRKYDSTGGEQWTRQFGTNGNDIAYSAKVDGSGNVYVAGYAADALPEQTSTGSSDGFVRKYGSTGEELWTRQFGTSGADVALSVSVDESGNVYVAGATAGALPNQTSAGGDDVFVRRYDASGAEQWTWQLGTGSSDVAYSVGVDASGTVYAAGYTLGTLAGQTSAGSRDAFVVRVVP